METSELEDVLAAMREGVPFQIGGGRCFETFLMTDGKLIVRRADDGYTEDIEIHEQWLREAFDRTPAVFRQYVAWWKEGRYEKR